MKMAFVYDLASLYKGIHFVYCLEDKDFAFLSR